MKMNFKSKKGVALLVVVGLLALLMISAVAFTTMMRVERAGASNFRHAVTAREMATVAVNRFIGDIDCGHVCDEAIIGDDIYPGWTNGTWHIAGGLDAQGHEKEDEREELSGIPKEVIFSVSPNRGDVAYAHILTERMMDFVPGYFRPDIAQVRPQWVALEADGRIVGRYAYVALNTSGLLDINHVGGDAKRESGFEPSEIQLGGLSDTSESFDLASFNNAREDGFVTMEEVVACGEKTQLDVDNIENFGIFSYIPNEDLVPKDLEPDKHNQNGKLQNPKVYVGGDLPNRFNTEQYTYADGTKTTLKNRIYEILERNDMLGQNFVGSDNRTERIDRYLNSLFDYIDDDDDPRDPDSPHVENTAMISGVSFVFDFGWLPVKTGAGTSMTLASGKFIHELSVTVGAWNPFGTESSDYTAEVTLSRDGDPAITLSSITPATTIAQLTPKMLAGIKTSLIPDGAGKTFTVPLSGTSSSLDGELTFASTGTVAAANAKVQQTSRMNITGTYKVNIGIKLFHAGNLVDQVEFNGATFMTDSFLSRIGGSKILVNSIAMRKESDRDTEWFESFDPRFNWIATDIGGLNMNTVMNWTDGTSLKACGWGIDMPNSLGGISKWAEYILQHPENIGTGGEGSVNRLFDGIGKRDNGTAWKDALSNLTKLPSAKNKPLESVGEMALIPIAPYFTMRLYDHKDKDRYSMVPELGYHRLYDFFTVRDPDNKDPLTGLVNPNSRQPDVITAVYNGMPVDEWNAAPKTLTVDEARDIGDRVYNELGGAAQDVSGIGAVDWLSILSSTDALKAKFTDEARREAVIRNAAGLFSTRQQSFLVLIRADAFSTRFGQTSIKQGSVLSTAQAVALVWRDPVPDKDGYHPCFVQMLKILTDDED